MKLIRLKEQTYLLPTNPPSTKTVLHPQIKVDKQWCYLKGEGTLTGLAEAVDEIDAYEQGLAALRGYSNKNEIERLNNALDIIMNLTKGSKAYTTEARVYHEAFKARRGDHTV